MVEQADACEGHRDAVLVAGHDDMIVAYAATSLGYELHTALMSTLDIIAEGEEGVRAKGHLCVLSNPGFLLFHRQHLRLCLEELLPGSVAKHVVVLVLRDIHVDGVVAISPADTIHKRQVHHFRVLAQPPDIGLVACQTSTVNTALLTSSDTDGLTVLHVADGVRLRIFQSDEGDDQVALGLWSEGLVLCGDVLEEGIVIELDLIAALFEGDAEHLFALDGLRHVCRINLNHIISALAFFLQDLDGLRGIVGGDHTVRNLTLQDLGCSSVTGI